MKKYFFFFLFFFLFPCFTLASWLTKQQACDYPTGLYDEEVYVLWPGKIPYIESFVKKDGFLYYFIHTFPDRDNERAYRDAGKVAGSYVKNSGSYFVSYDCARSKVKFHTAIRSLGGTSYGSWNWFSWRYLSYSLVPYDRDACSTPPDTLLDTLSMTALRLDRLLWLPRTTNLKCVGRSKYKPLDDGVVQFDIEEHIWKTEESFYSRYQYSLLNQKLRKIR